MKYEKFIKEWVLKYENEKKYGIRQGQSLMNLLAIVWFEQYDIITQNKNNVNCDCFYRDENIGKILEYLKNAWTEDNVSNF